MVDTGYNMTIMPLTVATALLTPAIEAKTRDAVQTLSSVMTLWTKVFGNGTHAAENGR